MTDRFKKHFDPKQLDKLAERAEELGEGRIREVEQVEWPNLIAAVKQAMESGLDPSDPKVQELAQRWSGLLEQFTGGDSGIGKAVGKLWQGEQQVGGLDSDMMRKLMAYIGKALQAGK